jgi:hypothetical protein
MSENNLSSRGARIVKALEEFADDLEAGVPVDSKYNVRTVEVTPKRPPDTGAGARTDRDKPR